MSRYLRGAYKIYRDVRALEPTRAGAAEPLWCVRAALVCSQTKCCKRAFSRPAARMARPPNSLAAVAQPYRTPSARIAVEKRALAGAL